MHKVVVTLLIMFCITFSAFAAKAPANSPATYKKALNKALIRLRIAPEIPQHYFNVAHIYTKLKKPYKAASVYRRLLNNKLIKSKRVRFKTYFNLASIYLFRKKFNTAIKYYSSAVKINPLSTPARLNLGTSYLNAKNYVKALDEYLQVLNNNPNYAIAYFNVATCYEKLGKFFKSKDNYKIFLDIVNKDKSRSFKRYGKYINIAKNKLTKKKIKSKIMKKGKYISLPSRL